MLKTRVKRGAREMWHGMHSLFPPESQSLCESRADSIGFTGAKLITGSSLVFFGETFLNQILKGPLDLIWSKGFVHNSHLMSILKMGRPCGARKNEALIICNHSLPPTQ
jgi:hypothetical protein